MSSYRPVYVVACFMFTVWLVSLTYIAKNLMLTTREFATVDRKLVALEVWARHEAGMRRERHRSAKKSRPSSDGPIATEGHILFRRKFKRQPSLIHERRSDRLNSLSRLLRLPDKLNLRKSQPKRVQYFRRPALKHRPLLPTTWHTMSNGDALSYAETTRAASTSSLHYSEVSTYSSAGSSVGVTGRPSHVYVETAPAVTESLSHSRSYIDPFTQLEGVAEASEEDDNGGAGEGDEGNDHSATDQLQLLHDTTEQVSPVYTTRQSLLRHIKYAVSTPATRQLLRQSGTRSRSNVLSRGNRQSLLRHVISTPATRQLLRQSGTRSRSSSLSRSNHYGNGTTVSTSTTASMASRVGNHTVRSSFTHQTPLSREIVQDA